MKNILIKLTLSLFLLSVVATSCDKGFEELNVNPTKANEIDPAFQFTYVLLQTSGERYENWRAVLIYSSTMIQHLAALPTYWSGDKYLYNAGYAASLFDRAYNNQVRDIVDLKYSLEKKMAEGEQVANLLAAVKIWRSVIFLRLTDLYGDIPYSEAGLGFLEGITKPKYDPQSEIYADMISEINEALSMFDAGQPTFGSADIIYGGDIDKWKKFGNSLLLRLGMRMSEVDAGTAQSTVSKALSGGIMAGMDDSAFIPHTDGPEGINRNGIGEVWLADGSQHMSKTFVDWMRNHGDPRLEILGSVPAGTPQKGLPNGYDATTIKEHPDTELESDGTVNMDQFSDVNPVLVTTASPMMIMSYAESELLAAEAAVRGWGGGDAETHYNNGVRAGIQQWGEIYDASTAVDDAAVDAYLAANPFDGSMQMVGEQLWAATFMNEYEAYNNYRRLGIPALVEVEYPDALPVTGGHMPRRLVYPQSEAAFNGDNLNAALSNQGINETDFGKILNYPVWWDK
ncbi:MAG: SusD/RagB family nutrient-binding outer membrane lipoprotein [Phaeodactylibacter sp.]|nr:SusD/RagB family nutrient-binding outer membrane lipoprotein [Phaeodactylibacter sp.]MCB9265195.1 SusD/RagB family nutrient-binding outer membrane lipoprotein [Lewinellaceae bacterium]MCB9285943.1 SusD/RagB family nutrient-binding outer membrane lipoprotein [Lewinellaceae bacterium]